MQSGRLTGVFLVPTMITRLLDDPRVHEGSYDSVRSVIYGASPMSPALLRRAMNVFKCDFINAFGAATVCSGWSGYVLSLGQDFGIRLPPALNSIEPPLTLTADDVVRLLASASLPAETFVAPV